MRNRISTPPKELEGKKLRRWIRSQRFNAGKSITKWARNVIARRKATKERYLSFVLVYCLSLRFTIYVQLMAVIRYFDRLESEMPKDKFEDLVRKVVRACPSLQASNIGAALLADAQQVVQFFYTQHVVNLGIIQTFCQEQHSGSDAVLPEYSPDDLEQQEDDPNGLSISTWKGQRTNRTSCKPTLRPSSVSPRQHVRGSMIRSTLLISTSNSRQHAGPYGICGGDHSVK